MLSDVVGEQELGPHEPDPVALELGDLLGLGGHGHVDHDLGPRHRDVLRADGGGRRRRLGVLGPGLLQDALVDGPGGPVHGDVHAVLHDLGGVAGPDDARGPQLPGDDGRVAGHAALVGDDGCGPAHGGDHVGHGHLGDQDVAFLDGLQAHAGVVDDDLSGCEPGARPEAAGDDVLAGHGTSDGLVGRGVPGGGDGPGLDDVGFVVLDAPLHVHGLLVVDLDLPSDLGDLLDAGIGDLLRLDHVAGDVLLLASSVGPADVLPGLAGDPLLDDLHLLLVDHVGVGRDLSSHDGLSEAVAGLDDDLLGPAVGVDCEHDPGELGVDHPLDHHSKLHVLVGEALLLAVRDGTGGEERGPAFPDLVEQVVLVHHVQVGLLLPREARVGQVLCGGAGPHGHEPFVPLGEEQLVAGHDVLLQVLGYLALLEHAPDRGGCLGQAVVGAPVDAGQGLVDPVHQLSALDEVVIRSRCEDESLGNGESRVGEFSQVGAFATHDGYVFHVQLVYVDDLLVHINHSESNSFEMGSRATIDVGYSLAHLIVCPVPGRASANGACQRARDGLWASDQRVPCF